MRPTALFSILLAVRFTLAVRLEFPAEFFDHPDMEKNEKALHEAANTATAAFHSVSHALHNPDDHGNDDRLKLAFGDDYRNHLPALKTQVAKFTDPNAVVKVGSRKAVQLQNPAAAMESQPMRDPNGNYMFHPNTDLMYSHVNVGANFFAASKKDQAALIGHEFTHMLGGSEDHLVEPPSPLPSRIFQEFTDTANNLPAGTQIKLNQGYAMIDNPAMPGYDRMVTANDLMPANIAATRQELEASGYNDMINAVTNPGKTADAWKLAMITCHINLRKRALTMDDPVGYYLTKRDKCSRPTDKTSTKADSKALQKTRGKPSTKVSKLAKKERAAKEAKVRKDLKTKATKGFKTVKDPRATKSTKGKGTKSTNGAKSAKTVKSTKPKGSKAKGSKVPKAGKGFKAGKASNRSKTSKGPRSTKSVKSNRKSVAKASKESKGSRGGKTAKSRGPKVAKNSKPKVGKSAGATGARAKNGGRASNRGKGANSAKGTKPANSRKASNSKSKTTNAAKSGNRKSSNPARKFKASSNSSRNAKSGGWGSNKSNTSKASRPSNSARQKQGGGAKAAGKPQQKGGGSGVKSARPSSKSASGSAKPAQSAARQAAKASAPNAAAPKAAAQKSAPSKTAPKAAAPPAAAPAPTKKPAGKGK